MKDGYDGFCDKGTGAPVKGEKTTGVIVKGQKAGWIEKTGI